MKPRQGKNMINRAKYKEIKKYDHRQLEEFLTVLYAEAFNDGCKAAEIQDCKSIETLISALEAGECKGIKGATAKKIKEFATKKGLVINA